MPVRASEAARSEAAGSEEAVMGESIGVEWIHLPFYEAIRSGRGRAVSGGKAGVTKSRMNKARQRSFTISIPHPSIARACFNTNIVSFILNLAT